METAVHISLSLSLSLSLYALALTRLCIAQDVHAQVERIC